MRILWGIIDSGGLIPGSSEVDTIYDISAYPLYSDGNIIGAGCVMTDVKEDYNKTLIFEGAEYMPIKKQGFTNQRYAIELRDFRREELTLYDMYTPSSLKMVRRLPQNFQYVYFYENPEEAMKSMITPMSILMPIHQKWFDMIASGESKYFFTNRLPKALR